jgi:pimeloyl-ACP methyl ester carboxylesterase
MATLVLVHGGTVTSRMWDPVLPFLRSPALAVDLPGRRYRPADLGAITRADWIEAVACEVDEAGLDDVVLVGHSSGGYVIPGAAARLGAGRVRHLVFIAATVPAEGRRPLDYLKPKLFEIASTTERFQRERASGSTLGNLRPGEPPIDTDLTIVENEGTYGLEAPGPLFEPFTWAGVPSPSKVPRTYVRCTQDRTIPADIAEPMIALLEAKVVDIDAGHMVSDDAPAELAALLDGFAAS